MSEERRQESFETRALRWAAGVGVSACLLLLGFILTGGKSWLEEKFVNIALQVAEVKKDTEDFPTIRVEHGLMWTAFSEKKKVSSTGE